MIALIEHLAIENSDRTSIVLSILLDVFRDPRPLFKCLLELDQRIRQDRLYTTQLAIGVGLDWRSKGIIPEASPSSDHYQWTDRSQNQHK